MKSQICCPRFLACENNIFYGGRRLVTDSTQLFWGENREARSLCLIADHDKFGYGAYKWTVQLVTNDSRLEKILFPIFWGLMTLRYLLLFITNIYGKFWILNVIFEQPINGFIYAFINISTFGNLESTTDWLEVVFIIIVLTTGLLLVTMLIGNIKVCRC